MSEDPHTSETRLETAEANPQVTELGTGDPWSFRDLALFVAFVMLALAASPLMVATVYAAFQPVLGLPIPPHTLFRNNPFFMVASQLVAYGLVFGYVYFLVSIHYRRPFWPSLRWKKPTPAETVRFFLGGILLALAVEFTPTLLPEAEEFPLERLFDSPPAAYTVAAFAVLVAPFMEELVFRGVLFNFLDRLAGTGFAVISTAVLFAGLHVPEYWGAWHHVLMILVVGIALSLARGLTGSLAPSMVLHLAYNATLMIGLYFETHHFRTLGANGVP